MKMFRTLSMRNELRVTKNSWKTRCLLIIFAVFFLAALIRPLMALAEISSIARERTIWISPRHVLVESGDPASGPTSIRIYRAQQQAYFIFWYNRNYSYRYIFKNYIDTSKTLADDLFEVFEHDGRLLFRRAGHTSYFKLDLGKFDALPVEMTYDEFIRFYVEHRPVFVSFERLYFWKSTFPKILYGLLLATLLFVALLKYRRLGKLFK